MLWVRLCLLSDKVTISTLFWHQNLCNCIAFCQRLCMYVCICDHLIIIYPTQLFMLMLLYKLYSVQCYAVSKALFCWSDKVTISTSEWANARLTEILCCIIKWLTRRNGWVGLKSCPLVKCCLYEVMYVNISYWQENLVAVTNMWYIDTHGKANLYPDVDFSCHTLYVVV